MKNTALLCCALVLLVCNACEKEKGIETKPVLPVFEDNFDRTSFGERWTAYYDQSDAVYLENNMVVITSPFGGAFPRLELKEGEYNKPEFKLSVQFKLDNVAIAASPLVNLSTNPSFLNFWFELRKESWGMGMAGSSTGGSISRVLKADEWYILQMSVTDNQKRIDVVEMNTGLAIMSGTLQFSQTVSGPWSIGFGSFDNPNGNRKLYIDNFKIY